MTSKPGVRENGHGVVLQEGFALRAIPGSCAIRGDCLMKPQGKARLSTLSQQCDTVMSRGSKSQKDPAVTETGH